MRRIWIEDGLTLRFPRRDISFSEGVEIGVIATLMALGTYEFTRQIARDNVEQARALAEGMGYRLIETPHGTDEVEILVTRRRARSLLRVIAGGL